MANFGILIRNSAGDVLIDGERRHPLLYAEGVLTYPDDTFHFPPTPNPVFPTWRVVTGVCWLMGLTRDANGHYNGVQFFITSETSLYVWVYEL